MKIGKTSTLCQGLKMGIGYKNTLPISTCTHSDIVYRIIDVLYFDFSDLVQVWMNSIHSCALPDKENLISANSHTTSYTVIPPPVILVGTHIDQIPQVCR